MAQLAEAYWRDAAEAPTELAGAAGYGEPVPPSVRAIARSIEDDEPEYEPSWCVDDGSSMTVLTTSVILARIERGELAPDLKVWRDGMPYWLQLHEVIELTPPEPSVASRDDDPESHIRRRSRRARQSDAGRNSYAGASRRVDTRPGIGPALNPLKSMAILLFILFAGIVVGFVLTAVVVGDPIPTLRLSAGAGPAAERCRSRLAQPSDRRTASSVGHRRWLHGSRRW